MKIQSQGAVVIGGGITTLNAVRCLGTNGVPVAVLQVLANDIAHYSRWSCDHLKYSCFRKEPESVLEVLKRQPM